MALADPPRETDVRDKVRERYAAGTDVLISAARVAPGGRAIGLDMTDEMLTLARANAAHAGAIGDSP